MKLEYGDKRTKETTAAEACYVNSDVFRPRIPRLPP